MTTVSLFKMFNVKPVSRDIEMCILGVFADKGIYFETRPRRTCSEKKALHFIASQKDKDTFQKKTHQCGERYL